MRTIDLRLLAEEPEKPEKKGAGESEKKEAGESGRLQRVRFGRSPSSGGTTKDIRSADSRAASEPAALLRDLGVTKLSGATPQAQMASAIEQARQNNKTFAAAFGQPQRFRSGKTDVIVIDPLFDVSKYPNIYISAIGLALQNVGALDKTFEVESRASRAGKKRNIIQATDGSVVIADADWIRSRTEK